MKKSLIIALPIAIIILSFAQAGMAKIYEPLKYEQTYSMPADEFYFLDLDQNGKKELYICTYGSTGYVYAYSENGSFLWRTWFRGVQRESGCTQMGEDIKFIYVDDVNNNKDLDIFAASSLRGEKINLNPFYYFERETDPETYTHKVIERWRFDRFEGISTKITSSDINNDGKKEVLIASGAGIIYVMDDSGTKVPIQDTYIITDKIHLFDVEKGDYINSFNNETIPEKLKTEFKNNKITLSPNAIITREEEGRWRIYDQASIFGLEDNGANLKVYAETDTKKTRTTYKVTPRLLNTITLDGAVYSILASDVDRDGQKEIIAGTYKSVYLIDGGSQKWRLPVNVKITGVYATTNYADQEFAVIATDGNKIYSISSEGKPNWEISPGKISEIAAGDIDNDTQTEILAAIGSDIKAYNMDGTPKWDYAIGQEIYHMRIISNNELAVQTRQSIHLLETDNNYAKNQEAYKYYNKAKDFYFNRDCKNVQNPLEKANKIFEEINNTEGLMRCEEINLQCQGDYDKQKLGDEYYALAEKYYNEKNYDDAKTYAQRAMEIYVEVGDTYSIAWKCDPLIRKIEEEEYKDKIENANKDYNQAYVFYSNEDYDNATTYLEKALRAYNEINYSQGIEDCNYIYDEIDKKEKINTANTLYEDGKRNYELSNYLDSVASFDRALDIYNEFNMSDKVSETTSQRTLAAKYADAEGYKSLAEECFNAGNYENATFYANQSKNVYLDLEDYEKSAGTSELMDRINRKTEENNMIQYAMIGGGIIAVIILIVAALYLAARIKNRL